VLAWDYLARSVRWTRRKALVAAASLSRAPGGQRSGVPVFRSDFVAARRAAAVTAAVGVVTAGILRVVTICFRRWNPLRLSAVSTGLFPWLDSACGLVVPRTTGSLLPRINAIPVIGGRSISLPKTPGPRVRSRRAGLLPSAVLQIVTKWRHDVTAVPTAEVVPAAGRKQSFECVYSEKRVLPGETGTTWPNVAQRGAKRAWQT
jgi:hypothetical protein